MRALLLGLGVLLGCCVPSWAEEEAPARRVVIVLDRGSAARETHRIDTANALRVWAALAKRGVDCHLVAAGVDGDDSTLVDDVPPTRPGLEGLARRPVFAFRGPTDVRAALGHVLADEGTGPVDVILLGPFEPSDKHGESVRDDVIERWNEDAPAGSRILAVRSHALARGLLEGAQGLVTEGRLVIGFDKPIVETQPFSPFQPEAEGIEARIRVVADVLGLGDDVAHTPLLRVRSDVKADALEVTTNAGRHTIVLRRRPTDGRLATLTFARDERRDDAHWLVEAPRPLSFRWEMLAASALLRDTAGRPAAPFAAVDVAVGEPKRVTLRLLRTRTGPAPAWRTRAAQGELPAGLTVVVGPEVQTSPEVGESAVTIEFAAQAGRPLEARGTLVLEADGIDAPIELPYEIRVGAGQAALEGAVHPAALPPSEGETRTTFRLVRGNENTPTALRLRAVCDGDHARWLRGLVGGAGGSVTRWDLREPLIVETGRERTLAFELLEDAPPHLVWPCTVTITPVPLEGVALEGRLDIAVRKRRPFIKLGGPPPSFRLEEGTLRSDVPFILQLDPDGGDGEFLLALLETPPTLVSRGGAIGWQAVQRGRGIWHVVPTGEWSGLQPSIFRDEEVHVDLEIAWPPGDTPGKVEVPVEVPARWGKRGFVLVALALMALVLGLLVIGYMRTPAVKGVLIYTIDGMDGTVGRLDLAAVGRKTRVIVADDKGKLSVAAKGDAIARVRPTRVGGMLEYTDAHGTKERRLLVDGVSLRLGRHLVRYIYGRDDANAAAPTPPAGEDLLGPEYDIESGRIDAVGDDAND